MINIAVLFILIKHENYLYLSLSKTLLFIECAVYYGGTYLLLLDSIRMSVQLNL